MSSQTDEVVITGLRAQIIANMRIIDPNLDFPIITTGYKEESASWGAMVWNNQGEVEYHVSGCHNAVNALRTLLSSTSCAIYTRYRSNGENDDNGDAGDAGDAREGQRHH